MLVLLLLVEGLATLGAVVTVTRIRLSGDARRSIESWLVAASAVAEARVGQAGALDSMTDGERLPLGMGLRLDGWGWSAEAAREGALVRLEVRVERRDAGGLLQAARRMTLLLDHPPSDTVRVLAHRARM